MASDNENSSEYVRVIGHYQTCPLINGHPKEYVDSLPEVATVPDTTTMEDVLGESTVRHYVQNHPIQESRFYQELESESPQVLHELGISLY
jgi:hypothetical protein